MCLLPNVFTKLSRQRYLNVHVEKDFFKAKYYSLHRLFFSWHPQFVGEDVVLLRLLPRTRNRVNENKHVLQKNFKQLFSTDCYDKMNLSKFKLSTQVRVVKKDCPTPKITSNT